MTCQMFEPLTSCLELPGFISRTKQQADLLCSSPVTLKSTTFLPTVAELNTVCIISMPSLHSPMINNRSSTHSHIGHTSSEVMKWSGTGRHCNANVDMAVMFRISGSSELLYNIPWGMCNPGEMQWLSGNRIGHNLSGCCRFKHQSQWIISDTVHNFSATSLCRHLLVLLRVLPKIKGCQVSLASFSNHSLAWKLSVWLIPCENFRKKISLLGLLEGHADVPESSGYVAWLTGQALSEKPEEFTSGDPGCQCMNSAAGTAKQYFQKSWCLTILSYTSSEAGRALDVSMLCFGDKNAIFLSSVIKSC